MRTTLLLALSCLPFIAQAQFLDQDFDGNSAYPLPYVIDTTAGNLWQVGPPQKAFFNTAHSGSRVIVTDTLNTYATQNNSFFTMKADLSQIGWYPVFYLRFYHAFQMDSLHAGGYAQVSWDDGATWVNIFDDWLMPQTIENYDDQWQPFALDTLSNDELGFTGASGSTAGGGQWASTTVCWTNLGFPISDSLFIRFNLYSDSAAQSMDGWMIDDVTLEGYFAHPIAEYTKKDDFFMAIPNPVDDRLFVLFDVDEPNTDAFVALYDMQGREVKVLSNGPVPVGVEHLLVQRGELPGAAGMMLLKARIGEREHEEKILFGP
ncbi:MAG: hypothetical protein ABI599_18165 [Flavobacteriales bacterium]